MSTDARSAIDLSATTDSPGRTVYRHHWSLLGQHTIRVVVSGSHVVGIDGFVVLK